jgi:hypothetical protein
LMEYAEDLGFLRPTEAQPSQGGARQ